MAKVDQTTSDEAGHWKFVEHAVAGGTAGIFAESLMHPLDTINTRCKLYSSAHIGRAQPRLTISHLFSFAMDLHDRNIDSRKKFTISHNLRLLWRILFLDASAADKAELLSSSKRAREQTVPLQMLQKRQLLLVRPESETNFVSMFRKIIRREGWRPLFYGIKTTIVGSIPSSAVYFCTYELVKEQGQKMRRLGDQLPRSMQEQIPRCSLPMSVVYFTAGACAEIACAAIYMPFEVAKTHMQLGDSPRSASGGLIGREKNFGGVLDAFRSIVRTEGFRGLYSGLGICLVTDLCFSGFQFLLYEHLKDWFLRLRRDTRLQRDFWRWVERQQQKREWEDALRQSFNSDYTAKRRRVATPR